MLRRTLLTALAAVVLGANANAATVTLSLLKDTAGAGTWELRAATSAGDNGGLASFNIPLLDIATLTNESPFYTLNTTNFRSAGFSELRLPATDNNAVDKTVFGSQQLIPNPTPNIQYGFGQTAGNWPAASYVAAALNKRPQWDANLLLASGTYAAGTNPRVNIDAVNLSILAFDDGSGTETITPTVVLGGDNVAPVAADANLGGVTAAIINHTFDDATGRTWGSLTPTVGSPAVAATLSSTGQFQWHTTGSARSESGVPYAWTATVTDSGGLTDTATLSLQLVVPEPATMPNSSADAGANGDGISDAVDDTVWPEHLQTLPFVPPPKPPYVSRPRPVLRPAAGDALSLYANGVAAPGETLIPAAAPEPSSLMLLAIASVVVCRFRSRPGTGA